MHVWRTKWVEDPALLSRVYGTVGKSDKHIKQPDSNRRHSLRKDKSSHGWWGFRDSRHGPGPENV